MSKTIKVIDLLNKIANGEETPIIKFKLNQHRFKYNKKDKFFDDIDDYSRCKCSIEFCELNDEIEIIEEQQDINIQELDFVGKMGGWALISTEEAVEKQKESINFSLDFFGNKLNEVIGNQMKLIQAVKQLDKQIKEKE